MKLLSLLIFFLLFLKSAGAQQSFPDSVYAKAPQAEYIQYIYNPYTKSKNLSYNYSDIWDFDNDGKKDSLVFIGNGGAHTYFYLCVKFSNEKITRNFPGVQLDMPYLTAFKDTIKKTPAIQFIVGDFDQNKTMDIYLNFNNDFSTIPIAWEKAGIKKKRVVLSFKNKQLAIKPI